MKGRYHFRVKSKKTVFEFDIKRNITVLKGDSATGKTTLLHMMYEYLRAGRESGYSVSADCAYYVYLRREIGRSWQDILFPLENTGGGSSRILDRLKELQQSDLLAVADGAAFGAEIENCLEYSVSRNGQRLAVWMPESVEYLILQSGLVPPTELQKILASVSDYVEAKDFESWEQFFTL